MGEIVKAKERYEESLRIRIQKFGPDHVSVAESYNNLGECLFIRLSFYPFICLSMIQD